MKKHTTTKPTTIPEGVVIGLNPRQYADRIHLLESVRNVEIDDDSDWYTVFRARKPLQFKAGESFYLDAEIPKTIVPSLSPVGESGTPSDPAPQAGTDPDKDGPGDADDIDSMTKGELIDALKGVGIAAKTSQKVDQLREALRAARMSDDQD